METRKPGQQAQTQSASQAQSGYKRPSQPTPGAGGPSTSRSEPSLPNTGGSASPSMPMDKFKKMIAIAAVALGVAIGAYLIPPSDTEPEPPTQAQIEERAQQYQQLLAQAGGVISVQRVKDSERQDALATIASDQDRQQLEQKQVPLVWITLWDTAAEDGDVVRVTSDGFRQEVPILHAPTRVAVPLPSSGTVAVTGSYDGGGGITIGILSGSQRIPIPYMRVGQTINVPVSATP